MDSASPRRDGRCEYCGTYEGDRRCTSCGAPKAPPAFNVIENFGFPVFTGEPGAIMRFRSSRTTRTWIDDDPVFSKLVKPRREP